MLFLKYWPLGKEIGFKETYEIVVRAPHPLEQRQRTLFETAPFELAR